MADVPSLYRVIRVILQVLLDPTAGGEVPRSNPDTIYFSVNDLESVHERASALECLSQSSVHGDKAGDIVTRPWGERSFYVDDPFGNGLCFVDARTIFTGR